jgi:hypothetical protein
VNRASSVRVRSDFFIAISPSKLGPPAKLEDFQEAAGRGERGDRGDLASLIACLKLRYQQLSIHNVCSTSVLLRNQIRSVVCIIDATRSSWLAWHGAG